MDWLWGLALAGVGLWLAYGICCYDHWLMVAGPAGLVGVMILCKLGALPEWAADAAGIGLLGWMFTRWMVMRWTRRKRSG